MVQIHSDPPIKMSEERFYKILTLAFNDGATEAESISAFLKAKKLYNKDIPIKIEEKKRKGKIYPIQFRELLSEQAISYSINKSYANYEIIFSFRGSVDKIVKYDYTFGYNKTTQPTSVFLNDITYLEMYFNK